MANSKSPVIHAPGKEQRKLFGIPAGQATNEIQKLYGRARKVKVIVQHTSYSNLAYVQVSPRDVFVDFLEAPGAPEGEDFVVRVVRVYMSHVAARSLSEVLSGLIERVRKTGKIEKLEG
jgi:hypothetical protein